MKKYWAELLGTYILVFVGTGAIMINEIIKICNLKRRIKQIFTRIKIKTSK